jgi:tRNA dimethylallyltransferase
MAEAARPGGPDALAIVGTTASGKTALSLAVAARLDAEIVSMDSRQVYRGMDIGTAKVSAADRALVPHHLIDVVDPPARFSAAEFSRLAREALDGIGRRGRVPMLVGGTGFFLRALTHPIFREPELEPGRRTALQRWLGHLADADLHRWLAVLDPAAAERLRAWGGRQRLLRTLEMPLLTGRTLGWWHRHAPPTEPPLRPMVFVLERPRAELDAAIDARVESMLREGLLDEVRELMRAGYDERTPGLRAHGYQEIVPALRGDVSMAAAVDAVKRATRAYAKRQRTWFRTQLPPGAVRLDGHRSTDALAAEVVRTWAGATGTGATS